MFHSNDKFAGRMMAVSKAMSGGPVYLSDEPTEFVTEAITPLVYRDGRLLRPLAPAGPLQKDFFYELKNEKLFTVTAPLCNNTSSLVVYNLEGGVGTDEETLTTTITSQCYAQASGMLQPYPGKWQVPAEGLVVYDWYNGYAEKLGSGYEVKIKGFGDRLLQISPIEKGWSVIGRTDKYLSAAAVEIVSIEENELKIKMIESGPLAIWSDKGVPNAKKIKFENAGGGLYKANITGGQKDLIVTISR
jgi:hypothetical protein